jgi:hypothetical protein
MDVARRPEETLVLECVRNSIGQSDIATIKRLVGNTSLDWSYLIRIATRHQVLPLLHRAMVDAQNAGVAIAPTAVAAVQQELNPRITRNRRLAVELVRLVRLGADAGLALLPFKGVVLACDIYGDLALRQFADVDLLVAPSQSAAAGEFLRSLGYESREDFGWEAHFVNPHSGICVDLHRGRLTPEDFPLPELFTRLWTLRAAVRIDEQRIEAPGIDHLLIILCIQVARDAWHGKTRLGKISDLAHVLNAGDRISWPRVQREARALRVARVVDFGIQLTRRITRIPLPAAVGPRPHHGITTLIEQEERDLFHDPSARPPSALQGHLFHFHLREHWSDRLRPYRKRWLSVMRPSRRDREALPLPPALSLGYYILRPVLVLRRYGRYLLRGRPP